MNSYIKMLRFLKPYKWIAILAPIFLIVEVVMNLLIPETMSYIIDIGIKNKNLDQVIHYSIIMLIYTVLAILFAFLSNFFSTWASALMVNDIRITTFKKALTMSFHSLDDFETAKVITRVTSDSNSLRWITRALLRVLFRAPILLIGAVIMAIRISPKLSIILIIIIPILFFSNYFIVKKAFPKYRLSQEKLEKVNMMTQENLENIRVVKAFNRGDYENEKFSHSINELMDSTIKANVMTAFTNPIFLIVINFSTAAVLYFGGYDVMNDAIEIGKIFAFITYLGQISGAMGTMMNVINIFPRAEASSGRVLELINSNLELENKGTTTNPDFKGKIEFRNVSFSYKDTPVLKNVSFVLNPGERLGIIGTTGSGKTTLVQLIARFYDVTSGDIFIDDVNIKDYDLHHLRSHISMVMQKALLFAGTIGDNIKFGNMAAPDEEVIASSLHAEAFEFIDKYENKFSSLIGERGINLSGGQKQRVSIARSLMTKPKILIFDDSTSAVDMTTEANILNTLRHKIDQTSVIIIAQRIQSIRDADQILILEQGKITGKGTHEDLLKSHSLYQEIYEMQLGGESLE